MALQLTLAPTLIDPTAPLPPFHFALDFALQQELPDTAAKVYALLAANPLEQPPSRDTLAAALNVTVRTIGNCLNLIKAVVMPSDRPLLVDTGRRAGKTGRIKEYEFPHMAAAVTAADTAAAGNAADIPSTGRQASRKHRPAKHQEGRQQKALEDVLKKTYFDTEAKVRELLSPEHPETALEPANSQEQFELIGKLWAIANNKDFWKPNPFSRETTENRQMIKIDGIVRPADYHTR